MTVLQIYTLISPVLGLAVVGVLFLVHDRQHKRALQFFAKASAANHAEVAMPLQPIQNSSSTVQQSLDREQSFAK